MELNQKLINFAGIFVNDIGEEHWIGLDNENKVIHLEPFTTSLDACFKWLVPKLFALHKTISLGYTTFIGEELNHWYVHILACDFTGAYLEGIDKKSPALALCKAIEKLIDGEKT